MSFTRSETRQRMMFGVSVLLATLLTSSAAHERDNRARSRSPHRADDGAVAQPQPVRHSFNLSHIRVARDEHRAQILDIDGKTFKDNKMTQTTVLNGEVDDDKGQRWYHTIVLVNDAVPGRDEVVGFARWVTKTEKKYQPANYRGGKGKLIEGEDPVAVEVLDKIVNTKGGRGGQALMQGFALMSDPTKIGLLHVRAGNKRAEDMYRDDCKWQYTREDQFPMYAKESKFATGKKEDKLELKWETKDKKAFGKQGKEALKGRFRLEVAGFEAADVKAESGAEDLAIRKAEMKEIQKLNGSKKKPNLFTTSLTTDNLTTDKYTMLFEQEQMTGFLIWRRAEDKLEISRLGVVSADGRGTARARALLQAKILAWQQESVEAGLPAEIHMDHRNIPARTYLKNAFESLNFQAEDNGDRYTVDGSGDPKIVFKRAL